MPETPVSTYRNFIDGEWVTPTTAETFDNRNPADRDDLLGSVPKSSAADVDAAVAAARAAFARWRLVPAPKRAEILYRAAQILSERKEEYARTMTREMGKILDETRGDVQEAVDMSYLMAGEGRRMYGQTVPSELRDKFAMSMRQPIGVCGMITAWNFPDRRPVVEDPAGAGLRQHSRVQARRGSARLGRELRAGAGRCRPAGRRAESRARRRSGRRRAAALASRRQRDLVHRVDGDRSPRQPGMRAELQESAPGDGRQERHPRDGRCEPRTGGRRRALGWFRHHRPALHGRQPRRRT